MKNLMFACCVFCLTSCVSIPEEAMSTADLGIAEVAKLAEIAARNVNAKYAAQARDVWREWDEGRKKIKAQNPGDVTPEQAMDWASAIGDTLVILAAERDSALANLEAARVAEIGQISGTQANHTNVMVGIISAWSAQSKVSSSHIKAILSTGSQAAIFLEEQRALKKLRSEAEKEQETID